MAIGTNDAVEKFGTPVNVVTSGGGVANGAMSVAGDNASQFTNIDNASVAAIALRASLTNPAGSINIYGIQDAIDGVNNEGDTTLTNKRVYLGSITPPTDQSGLESFSLRVPLMNASDASAYTFFIENTTGVALAAGWLLDVTPIAVGPKA